MQLPEQDPGQLPLEGLPEIAAPPLVFDVNQRRAFGSIPGLLGRGLDLVPPEHIPDKAWQRVEPQSLQIGLMGREGRYSVDGIALTPLEYQAVVRSPRSFQSSVQAKTMQANQQLHNPIRFTEKEIKSGMHALENKAKRQAAFLKSYADEAVRLDKLLDWQRTPGYARASELEMRSLASEAWHLTFRSMLATLRDGHGLTANESLDMDNAMARRLFAGPQKDKVQYWGAALQVARRHNQAKKRLFEHRQTKIAEQGGKLATRLEQHYESHDVS